MGDGRVRIAEAGRAEALLEAGRQIQAANDVARNAQERAAMDRQRLREVEHERAAMKVKVAELGEEVARAQRDVGRLGVQLAESTSAAKCHEEQPAVVPRAQALGSFMTRRDAHPGEQGTRETFLKTSASSPGGTFLPTFRSNDVHRTQDSRHMIGKELCSSGRETLHVPAKAEGAEAGRPVGSVDRVEQLKAWVLCVAGAQPPLSFGSEHGTPLSAPGSPQSVPGSPRSRSVSRTSRPSSLGGAKSPPKRRALSNDNSCSRSRGWNSCDDAARSLSRSEAVLANATRTAHIFKSHSSVVHHKRVPEPVTQGVLERHRRNKTISCKMADRVRDLA